MEAKLIKVLEHYHLYDGDKAIATTIVGNPMLLPNLSLKNCQAIERGYDLDELALEAFELDLNCQGDCNNYYERLAYKLGMIKMIGLLGDKKFSEEDMFRMFTYGHALTNAVKSKVIQDKPFGEIFNDFIQSLQQTEWDVEIEMESIGRVKLGIGSKTEQLMPKLDADGCLILKLK